MKLEFKNIMLVAVFAVLFLFVYALGILNNQIDNDLFARLIMGQGVLETGFVVNDMFSFTQTHTWYDPEWLSSTLICLVKDFFGLKGIIFLKILFCFLMLFSIYLVNVFLYSQVKVKTFFYLLLTYFFLQAGYLIYSTRCQLISFIFLAFWILILEKARKNDNHFLCFAPFLMLLWLNLHGGCIAGVGILVIYAFGEMIQRKPFKKYLIALFFVCLMFFINPYGVEYLKFIYESAFLDRAWIAEWQSFFNPYLNKSYLYFFFLVYVIFSCFLKAYIQNKTFRKIDLTKIFLILIVSILSLKHIKHIGIALVVSSIIAYEDIFFVYDFYMEKLRKYLRIDKKNIEKVIQFKNSFLLVLVGCFSLVVLAFYPMDKVLKRNFFSYFPVNAMEFLQENKIYGNIFVPFSYGSFVAYKYYPNYKIYMDGRQEQVYTLEIFDEHMFFLNQFGSHPNNLVEKYKPDIFLLDNSWRCHEYFKKETKYTKIYSDDKFIIYVLNKHKKFNYLTPQQNKNEYISKIFNNSIKFKKEE